MLAQQTFKPNERLKSRKMIECLFKEGNIIHHYPFKVLYLFTGQASEFPVQLAVSVSKRIYKKAVDRNHIKRKIRESYRKNKHFLYDELKTNQSLLHIFIIYTAKENLPYHQIDAGIKSLIEKIRLLKE